MAVARDWSSAVTVMFPAAVTAVTDADGKLTRYYDVATMIYYAPDQRSDCARSATSAPTSSTSTCLSRSAKRYSTPNSCSPPSARCSPGSPTRTSWSPRQLKRLDAAIDAKKRERARLLDAYQAGLLELEELTRRTGALTARRNELTREKETLTTRSTELATQNRLRRRLAEFSERSSPHSTNSTSRPPAPAATRGREQSASPAGESRSTSRSRSRRATARRRPTRPRAIRPTGQSPAQERQATVKRSAPAFRSSRWPTKESRCRSPAATGHANLGITSATSRGSTTARSSTVHGGRHR